jgi:hypothetical protein
VPPAALFDDRTGLAELDRLAVLDHRMVMVPPWSASISFMIFIASMMHTASPSLTTLADVGKALAPGLERAVEGADHRRLDDAGGGRCRFGSGPQRRARLPRPRPARAPCAIGAGA